MNDWMLLFARVLMGVPFILWGWEKLRGGEAKMVPVIAAFGLPDAKALAYLVGLCEFVGGVGVVLGYPAKTFGILLGLWCLVTAFAMHRTDKQSLMSHMTMAGGFFMLGAVGAGTLALFHGAPSGIFAHLH